MSLTKPKSRDVLGAFVRSTRDPILIADWETARFVEANPAAVGQLGYTDGELRAMTGGDLSQLPREEHRRISQELIEHGQTSARSVPIRRKDGTLVCMDLWVNKFTADGLAFSATMMRASAPPALRDDRFRIAHNRVLESEAFYRGVVTCTGDAVIVLDATTCECIEANPAACTLFGYTSVQFQSITCTELFSRPIDELFVRIHQDLDATGHSVNPATPLRRADGTAFVGDTMQNAFESGGRRMIVMIVRDVSELHAQREELERSQQLAAIGKVAAGVAHEINNPAAFVLMNADVVDGQLDSIKAFVRSVALFADTETNPARKRELLELAAGAPDIAAMQSLVADNREGLERIRAVTRDLRLFSRMEERVIVEEDLNAAIRGAISLLRNELRHHAIVRVELDDNLPTFPAQRGKLGQVATNLLLNAVQSITEGHAGANEIRVTTQLSGGEILFSVEDTGTGIEEESVSHVFEPFFTTKPREQGTGLGLALCASIVAAHGGRIDVVSTVGIGTTFSVRIPVDTGLTVAPSSEASTPEVRARRVLVIDDDPGMVRAYRRMLRNHDATVTSSAAEALALLGQDDAYDVILCDLMMPELDGPQFYETLMERAPHLAERIVFCTGGAFTARARDFVANVGNEVIEKPLSPADLIRLLGKT